MRGVFVAATVGESVSVSVGVATMVGALARLFGVGVSADVRQAESSR